MLREVLFSRAVDVLSIGVGIVLQQLGKFLTIVDIKPCVYFSIVFPRSGTFGD